MRLHRLAASCIAACSLSLPLSAQDAPAREPPSAEEVAAVTQQLDQALKGDDVDAQLGAIHAAAEVAHPDVVKRLADQLASKNRDVRAAAISALGENDHPDAVKALHSLYTKDRPLREDEGLFVTLLMAIGKHGDPASVALLEDKPFDQLTIEVGRARIFALGNIRTKDSVEALIKSMRLGGPSRRRGTSVDFPFMGYFRTALTVLTGTDQGATKEEWQDWWRKNEKSVKISPERPAVYAHVRQQWEEFWGEPYSNVGTPDSPAKGNPAEAFRPVAKPTEEQVTAALASLDAAWKGDDELAQVAAIADSAVLIDPRIVESIARGTRKRSPAVAVAAVDALGWMQHPDALKTLHGLYRDGRFRRDEYLLPRLLKAIGRYGDPSSLPILGDKSFRNDSRPAVVARILSLARIRTKESVQVFMKALPLGPGDVAPGGGRPVRAPRFMKEASIALQILTGQDLGTSKQAWLDWWKRNEKTFEVPAQPPALPDAIRAALEEYWGEPYRS